jgi:hypothetical protein
MPEPEYSKDNMPGDVGSQDHQFWCSSKEGRNEKQRCPSAGSDTPTPQHGDICFAADQTRLSTNGIWREVRIPFCTFVYYDVHMQSALDGDIEWLHVRGHQAPINPPHGTCSQALARGEGSTLGGIWRCHSRWAYAMRLVSKRLDGDVKILQALTPRSRGAQIREVPLRRSCMSCQNSWGLFSSFRWRMVVIALVICLDSSVHWALGKVPSSSCF